MIALLAVLAAASFQETPPPKPEKLKPVKKNTEWTSSWSARLDLVYNTNVWQLEGDDQDRLLDDLPGDQISGRFDDMESVEDWSATPSIKFAAKGPSPLGGKLDASVDLEWEQYFTNPARSHFTMKAGANQSIGKDGRIGLDLEFLPDYFQKDYLVDATDLTGSNSSSERIYKDAHYREFEMTLSYRHELTKSAEFSVDGVAALGLRNRDHGSPFAGRDELGTSIELGLRANAWKRVKGKLSWKFEGISTPTKSEILLLDEPLFGVDLNGDGDSTDMNARTLQSVDRSLRESSLTFGVDVDISSIVTAGLEWTRTWKDYSSSEPFDVSHRDRSDVQDKLELSVRAKFNAEWEARLGIERTFQETDRPADPGAAGETTDYQRTMVMFTAIFKW
jgi:hypothetical protein